MKWTVNNFPTHKLCNENGEVVASIKHRGSSYAGYSKGGTQFISVACGDENSFIVSIRGCVLDARMELGDNTKSIVFRPARAECIRFRWNESPVCIKQLERRDFVVSSAMISGTVTGMLGWRAAIHVSTEDEVFAALLYIFAHIMLHEDDVDIV
jgi:hypothetical protein